MVSCQSGRRRRRRCRPAAKSAAEATPLDDPEQPRRLARRAARGRARAARVCSRSTSASGRSGSPARMPAGGSRRRSRTIRRAALGAGPRAAPTVLGERAAGALVIGWPLNMDGSEGPRCQAVRAFADALDAELGLPILLWDERLSTFAAEEAADQAGLHGKKRAEMLDALAAAAILQDALRHARAPPPRLVVESNGRYPPRMPRSRTYGAAGGGPIAEVGEREWRRSCSPLGSKRGRYLRRHRLRPCGRH